MEPIITQAQCQVSTKQGLHQRWSNPSYYHIKYLKQVPTISVLAKHIFPNMMGGIFGRICHRKIVKQIFICEKIFTSNQSNEFNPKKFWSPKYVVLKKCW